MPVGERRRAHTESCLVPPYSVCVLYLLAEEKGGDLGGHAEAIGNSRKPKESLGLSVSEGPL